MKRTIIHASIIAAAAVAMTGCLGKNTATLEANKVAAQQDQYSKGQPVPAFDWSLERDLMIQLYELRNQRVATHSVWRSDYGTIEYDCPSFGYGMPYDVSLTNPLQVTDEDPDGHDKSSLATIEMPEPNGIFASKNTSATWVFCVGENGALDPIYIEAKVTVFPFPVNVDYTTNRVVKSGQSTATIKRTAPTGTRTPLN